MSPHPFKPTALGDLLQYECRGSHLLRVSPHGAHILAWQPASAVQPVLFLSPRSLFTAGKAIRGGVPLCFPWFGPKADEPTAPQHGFARTRTWKLERAEADPEGTTLFEFSLHADATTLQMWPHLFTARLTLRAGHTLAVTLAVLNTGAAPFTFTAALHTYLAVSDVRNVTVHGLEDTEYLDKAGGRAERHREGAGPIRLVGEVDRVYLDTTATCTVNDPGWRRRIHVAKSGSRTTVLWNPGADKARALADLGEEAWPGFVCVETCNAADDAITLAPGAAHALGAEIRVEPA